MGHEHRWNEISRWEDELRAHSLYQVSVPGGWLYLYTIEHDSVISHYRVISTMTYVPKPPETAPGVRVRRVPKATPAKKRP